MNRLIRELRTHIPIVVNFLAGLVAVLPQDDVSNWWIAAGPIIGYVVEFFTSPAEKAGNPFPLFGRPDAG